MATKQAPLFGDDDATAILAMSLALHAFRTPLEDLHAGTFPSSQTGDYSDVKVVTPYGEIPWNRLSRLSDEEMKALMIEVVSTLFTLLVGLDDKNVQIAVTAFAYDDIVKWDRPTIDEGLRTAIQHPSRSANPAVIRSIIRIIEESEANRHSGPRDTADR
ncbi:hypothetical protein HFO56_39485 [Rhizobium laguerreae]|uniref:hypothetical protein n=1 Tax=Rhizobium laguerreae TaxID=1076926 RepID=UPI001C9088E4|nr:hypothetical protein [Rhizobium laguerreae]MBY3158384.1 hypothetical protein [Rhizobium laguerreae]